MNWKVYALLFCGKITLSRWLTYGDDFHVTLKPFNDSRVNFDAMTANRVYRNALDMDFVKSELKKSAGKQFDPALTQIMLELIDNGTINVEKTMAMSEKGDNNEK